MGKSHIKTGDVVKVIAGNEKGKTGTVRSIIAGKDRAIVEGLNIVSKHNKPSAASPNGGIDKVESGIHISNLMLVDGSTSEAVKTGRKVNEAGKLQRYSKKSGEFIK
jgi:large subunit ribosomal protein L24